MPAVLPIPRSQQCSEPWANGAGTTTVVLREPDDAMWQVRVSVATVDRDGPFSELPGTRRLLVPLDAAMTLRFPDGRTLAGARMDVLPFDGAPAPSGLLPDGPTRDFNLMLRGDACGEVAAHTLADSTYLPMTPETRWLVFLASGQARIRAGADAGLALDPQDAAVVIPDGNPGTVRIEGAGEIVLARLYACHQDP